MEDIIKEPKNQPVEQSDKKIKVAMDSNGEAVQHGPVPEGMLCACTWDEITEENYVEYMSMPSGTWHASLFGRDTILQLLSTQFSKYLSDVEKAMGDCAASVRRLVSRGPPEWVEDSSALPLPAGDTHIEKLWFSNEGDGNESSARLKGSLTGKKRLELWNTQKKVLAYMEELEAENNVDNVDE